ncbi:MAG: iodotyrosine deiodinase [Planctomycetota bacterium]|jgi:iodotyrosine deiodinase
MLGLFFCLCFHSIVTTRSLDVASALPVWTILKSWKREASRYDAFMSDDTSGFIPLEHKRLEPKEMEAQGEAFLQDLDSRRSVRFFSDQPVPKRLIELAIEAASTAPSGAHMQPWTFVAISDANIKREIRIAAEKEEYISYEGGRMKEEWLRDLAPLGTDWHKPFLETVPWIVVLMAQRRGKTEEGNIKKHYYVQESVGIAAGLFIAALHKMGLCTLTHTPSPMAFLQEILERPKNEVPFILFPIGFPTDDCVVPDLKRKPLDDVSVWFE